MKEEFVIDGEIVKLDVKQKKLLQDRNITLAIKGLEYKFSSSTLNVAGNTLYHVYVKAIPDKPEPTKKTFDQLANINKICIACELLSECLVPHFPRNKYEARI